MLKTKVTVRTATLDAARSVVGILSEVVVPAPDAVTRFVCAGDADARLVEAYFSEAPDLLALDAAVAELGKPGIGRAGAESVPDENWVALSQAALPPVTAGRFTIHGSHDRHRVGSGPNALEIDAGEAFGTAHHATTQGCLMALDRLVRSRRFHRIGDIGCGSGVLALAASRILPAASIIASDIDPIAIDVARENARRNRAGARVRFVVATGFAHAALRSARFDLVLANILAGPLIRLASAMRRALHPRGMAVLSGLLTSQAAEVSAAYRAQGFFVGQRHDIAGWTTLVVIQRGD